MRTRAPTVNRPHGFLCDGKSWTVERYTPPQSKQTGLRFRLGEQKRFLLLSRGTLPTEREMFSITDDVLRVLLQRAQPQPHSAVAEHADT